MPPGRLYVCAVPIGNLDDASPRLRQVLSEVDAIACEDTRSTGRLLGLLDIAPAPRLLAHHEHNERDSAAGVVGLLVAGNDVALVSDAGTPAVSDPGVPLVATAHEAGVEVVAVPGPSSVAAALSVAGLHGSGHRFVGFLPRGEQQLLDLVRDHRRDLLVAFESPARVRATLAAVAVEQPTRELALCRELTKRHEEVRRGVAGDVLAGLGDADPRGECVLVLAPVAATPGESGHDDRIALDLVGDLVDAGLRRRVAARIVAAHLGGSASMLYDADRLRRRDDVDDDS